MTEIELRLDRIRIKDPHHLPEKQLFCFTKYLNEIYECDLPLIKTRHHDLVGRRFKVSFTHLEEEIRCELPLTTNLPITLTPRYGKKIDKKHIDIKITKHPCVIATYGGCLFKRDLRAGYREEPMPTNANQTEYTYNHIDQVVSNFKSNITCRFDPNKCYITCFVPLKKSKMSLIRLFSDCDTSYNDLIVEKINLSIKNNELNEQLAKARTCLTMHFLQPYLINDIINIVQSYTI